MCIISIPLAIIIDIQKGYPNQVIEIIILLIATICTFTGITLLFMTIGDFNSRNATVVVAGKVINNKDIKNIKNMTLLEKVKVFNIMGIVLRILMVLLFLGIMFLIVEDPFHIFTVFENVARVQLFTVLGLVIVGNPLFMIYNNIKISKAIIIVFILGLTYIYFITIKLSPLYL